MKRCLLFIFFLVFAFHFGFTGNYFAIGEKEGEGELISPSRILEGPDGNIYIYDSRDAYIKVYSPKGIYLRKMGGKGEGPGDIKRTRDVFFDFVQDEELLFFTEFWGGHKWITFMTLNGKFHRVLKLEVKEAFAINRAYSIGNGEFLALISYSQVTEKKGDYFLFRIPLALVKIDAQGRIASTLIQKSYFSRISFVRGGADAPIPFVPFFAWIPYKINYVIFSDGLSQYLMVYDHLGQLRKKIEIHLPEPKRVTKEALDNWRQKYKERFRYRNSGWYEQWGKVVEKYKKSIYDKKPNISSIDKTPEGNILVRGTEELNNEKMDFWLLSDGGKVLANIKTMMRGVRISKHYIFFRVSDKDGHIHVYCMNRQGAEKDDLKKLENLKIY